MTYAPGIYDGMTDADYHGDNDSLSSSGARVLLQEGGPAVYRYELEHGREAKDEYDFGHAAHKYVLGEGAEVVRIEADNWRGKAAQEAKAQAHAEGRIPLLAKDDDKAREMARVVHEHPLAGGFFADGRPEQSIFWVDEEFGVPLRARPDWVTWIDGRLVFVDYKSSKGRGRKAFAKAAADYGYFMQHPFYTAGARALGMHPDPGFVFVSQSKTPPHILTMCELIPREVALGHALNRRAIQIYAECRATGEWPDDSNEIHSVELPAWARYQAEELLA